MPAGRKSRGALRSVLDLVGIFAGAIILAYVLQAFLVKPFQIPSESMMPTIDPGDRILVNRLAYHYGSLSRGDVVVFESVTDPGIDLVKRVIAVAGDTVEVKGGQVFINGEPQEEPYVEHGDRSTFPSQTVPERTFFVLGDNRADSQDSRFWKPPWVPEDNIVGKAFFVYWPPGRMGTL